MLVLAHHPFEVLEIAGPLGHPRDQLLKLVVDVRLGRVVEGGEDDLGPFLVFRPVAPLEFLGEPEQPRLELVEELRVFLLASPDVRARRFGRRGLGNWSGCRDRDQSRDEECESGGGECSSHRGREP